MSSTAGRGVFVFLHGIGGFSRIRVPPIRIDYYRGIPSMMCETGVEAHFAPLPSTAPVEARARALAAFLGSLPQRRVVLVGHSMGGLDARYLAHALDPERRVRAVVTVATPHRGTPLAAWLLESPRPLARVLRALLVPGLRDLTPEACARFNDAVPDRGDVRYVSYAAVRPADEVPLWLRPFSRRVERDAGPNDTQVPLSSARWGEFRGVLRADHLELVGWSLGAARRAHARPFDHRAFFRRLVADAVADLDEGRTQADAAS